MSKINRIFATPLNPYLASIALAVASVVFALMIGGKLWGITTGESQLAGHLMRLFGSSVEKLSYFQKFKLPEILDSGPQMHVFGLILGGFVTSLIMGEFAIRQIPGKANAIMAVVGGVLLGYGSRLAAGCNIGNFWSAFPSAGINAVTFFAGVLIGSFTAVKLVVERKVFVPNKTHLTMSPTIQRGLGIAVLIISLIVFGYVIQLKYSVAAWFWFGVIAAYIGYRGRLCFASAYRDIFVSGARDGRNAVAVALGIVVQSLFIAVLLSLGYRLDLSLAAGQGQLQVLLGGVLFGFGVVLLGGCIFSSAYRAGSGAITSLIGWLSTIFVGMPPLTITWDFWYVTLPRHAPNLTLYSYGIPQGMLVSLLLPLAWLLYAARIEGFSPSRSIFASLAVLTKGRG